jgi:hypothetical protein
MNEDQINQALLVNWLLIIGLLAFASIHYYLQQKTVSLVRLENREIKPAHVWFQLIPIINLVWSFFVVRRVAASIANELNSPIDDSILGIESKIHRLPTYPMGLLTCILMTISSLPIPLLKGITFLGGLVAWIIYWIQLANYRKILKERALITSGVI